MGSTEKIIKVCMGSSCFSRGNKENLEIIRNFIKNNSINAEIQLTGYLCEGNCNIGPNISINDKKFRDVDESRVELILNDLLTGDDYVQS